MNELGINKAIASGSGQSGGPCRESSLTIIQRRMQENSGRAELYEWLEKSLKAAPMSFIAEEQLWSMLIRERPY